MQLLIAEFNASVPETVPTDIDASTLSTQMLMLPGASSGLRAYSGPKGDVPHRFRMPLTLRRFAVSNHAYTLPSNWTAPFESGYSLNGELLRFRIPTYVGCPLSVKVAVFIKSPPATTNGDIGKTATKMALAWDDYQPGFGGARDISKNILFDPMALWQTNTGSAGYDADKYKSWTRTFVIVPDTDGVMTLRLYGMMSGGNPVHDATVIVS